MRIASRIFYLLAALCLVTFIVLLVSDTGGNLFALFLVLLLICLGMGFQLDSAAKKREQKRQGLEEPQDPDASRKKQAVLMYNATAATTQANIGNAKAGGMGSSFDAGLGNMSGTQKYGVLSTLADDLKKKD